MSTIVTAHEKSWFEDYSSARRLTDEYLYFELFCSTKESYQKLRQLRDAARNCSKRVSRIYRLFGQDCLVQGGNDNLVDLKLQSKQMVMIGDEPRLLTPITILAFACEMPNHELLYLGLSEYPDEITHNDTICKIRKRCGMMWKGFMQISHHECSGCRDCIKTVDSLKAIMKHADDLGILQSQSFA